MSTPSRGVAPLQTESSGAAPPDAFGPFHVLHQAGAGTLGPVFRAFDPERDRLVAVKVYRLGLTPDRMHQLVSAMERLIAIDLRHPGIVAPIAAGTDGIVVYVAQEFTAADSLDVVMRERGPLPPASALGIAAQVAAALDFAAIVDVYHGALHPRDVLLADEDARLTGLGVARVLERLHAAAPVRRPYSAPERVTGAQWDRRADIFGLAALTHEMLWGKRIAGIGDDAAAALTELPASDLSRLRAVFARALAELPSDRYEIALDFVTAIKAAFPDVTIPGLPTIEGTGQTSRPASRKQHQQLPFDAEASGPDSPPDGTASSHEDNFAERSATSPAAVDERHEEVDRDRVETPSAPVDAASVPASAPGIEASHVETPQRVAPAPDEQTLLLRSGPQVLESILGSSSPEQQTPDAERQTPASEATAVDVRLRESPAETRAAVIPKPSDTVWDHKISQPSLKWIERETAPPAHDEPELFRSIDGAGVPSRRWWPTGLAIVAALAVGFAAGYMTGAQRSALPASEPLATSEPAGTSSTTPAPTAAPDTAKTATAPITESAPAASARSEASSREAPSAVKEPVPRVTGSSPANEAAAASAAADARLLVRSVPAGATVLVDGVDRGRTPVTIRELTPGTHRLRLTRDGYVTENQRVDVPRSRRPKSIRITLKRTQAALPGRAAGAGPDRPAQAAPARGDVQVESLPTGAQVFLDGKLVGTTPIATMQTTAGEHVLRIELQGYRRWSSSISVVGGQRTRVTAALEK